MITTLAVEGYRSLRSLVVPLGQSTVITGANGTGKSSLYRALRLLAECGQGRVVSALAREGGLASALWAGPETLQGARRGAPVQGTTRTKPVAIKLGYAADDLGYLIDLGLPQPRRTVFDRDPELKREIVFSGPVMRRATTLVERTWASVVLHTEDGRQLLTESLPSYQSVLTEYGDPSSTPEIVAVRRRLRDWRFYDGFRTDIDAPSRRVQVGTRTLVMADDGSDVAAAAQTIKESGQEDLDRLIARAFDDATLQIQADDGRLILGLRQRGMLRTMSASELSDGTLRFILWATALLSIEPPRLMVLNEPETSMHPDLLPALADLIQTAADRTQVIVVSHDRRLVQALGASPEPDADVRELELVKDLGETRVAGQGLLSTPAWEWGSRGSR